MRHCAPVRASQRRPLNPARRAGGRWGASSVIRVRCGATNAHASSLPSLGYAWRTGRVDSVGGSTPTLPLASAKCITASGWRPAAGRASLRSKSQWINHMASVANTLHAKARPRRAAVAVASGGTGEARAPLPEWSSADAAGHIVQFYESDALLLDAVAEFLGAALQRGDAAISIATEAHRAGIEERLREKGLDLDAAREAGRYL